MKKKDVGTAGLAQLISVYREAAHVHAVCTESGDFRSGNKAMDLLVAIYSELRRRGAESQKALLPLLADEDKGVRLSAAAHALEFAPMEGAVVLDSLVPLQSILGFVAEQTLKEWRAGRLTFP